ncbi:MAG: sigma 54-interacting transcriptional regulator [Alphaproteobacteria bacterium]|nr:sigma 54-interacting transcriptional regulator [Alphaproteobacteria bacterium]
MAWQPERELDEAPALREALRAVVDAGERGVPAVLPRVGGIDDTVLLRWLYRVWLGQRSTWGPLIVVDGQFLGRSARDALVDALREARDGWLVLLRPPSGLHLDALARSAREVHAHIVVLAEDRVAHVPVRVLQRLQHADVFHVIESDPALSDLRRSLLSHCRSASVVHLTGPPGTGKRELARWAHARLGDRMLSEVGRDADTRPVAGQWVLYPEVSELDPDRLHHLRAQLEAGRAVIPPPPSEAAGPAERPSLQAFDRIVGSSPALVRVLDRAARAARSPLPVLILGESGVGKELFAQAIHEASGRRGPYHPVDISTLSPSLVESELFGHAAGAFTGATSHRKGAARTAERGTLFLDELGNVEPKIQAKLLRLLQEKTVQPVGSDEVVKVDVRFVAATNADLEAMVRRGEFRGDLLSRLEAITLHIPPLRARGDDVMVLAASFFAEARGLKAAPAGWLSDEAAAILQRHHWPGNVRELRQTMLVAAFECESGPVRPEHLGPLAPANRHPVPLITTQSVDERGERPEWGLPRTLGQRMTMVTMRVPSLADRGDTSVRHAILSALEGRPIRLDALVALSRRTWAGNVPELQADVAALVRSVDGPIDLPAVARHLPHLLTSVTSKPIQVLWNPVVDGGEVVGLERTFRSRALLLGRVRSVAHLEQVARVEEPEGRGRLWDQLAAVKAACHEPPACLPFVHLPHLSRAHVLITLDDQGFTVHALPGVALAPWVSDLTSVSGRLRPVEPGRPQGCGEAVELRLRDVGGREDLQLFLFAGQVARVDHGPTAVTRAVGEQAAVRLEGTRVVGVPSSAPKEAAPNRPSTPWTLSAAERELLNDVVVRYEGGAFSAHLRSELGTHRGHADLGALVGFVLDVRPTQYCALLYEFDGNGALRDELCTRAARKKDRMAWLEALPKGIREAIEDRLT